MKQPTEPQQKRARQLCDELKLQVEIARDAVYELGERSPLERLELPGGKTVFAKREDTSTVHSYKWRGAFFKMRQLVSAGSRGPFVAASAGNHAQGIAISARKLQVPATIFMPRTTPQLKQDSVARLGGEFVELRIFGDGFDDAAAEAARFLGESGGTMIKPFDDVMVIAGQATVGVELFEQNPDLTRVYVPIGGGGLASGIAFANKYLNSAKCQVIGVEVEGQNSMQLSVEAGSRISLDWVDRFCDGTAVRQPGEITFELCQALLDDIVLVTNQEVSGAIQVAWEVGRFIPEPSGAIGLAAAIKYSGESDSEVVGTIVTGSNTDFKTFPKIVRQSQKVKPTRRYFRFTIDERNGSLIEMLDEFLAGINIVDFQYGKSDNKTAFPVVGVEGSVEQLDALSERMSKLSFDATELTGNAFLDYRVIPFHPDQYQSPFFLRVDFPDRPGALRELMRKISTITNICYFNFVDTGESEGHALIGFESAVEETENLLTRQLKDLNFQFTSVEHS